MTKNDKTHFFYVLYSDETLVFEQSERAQGPIYIINGNNKLRLSLIFSDSSSNCTTQQFFGKFTWSDNNNNVTYLSRGNNFLPKRGMNQGLLLSACVGGFHNMYLLTEWEGRTGKYLARGRDVRSERSEVRAS